MEFVQIGFKHPAPSQMGTCLSLANTIHSMLPKGSRPEGNIGKYFIRTLPRGGMIWVE